MAEIKVTLPTLLALGLFTLTLQADSDQETKEALKNYRSYASFHPKALELQRQMIAACRPVMRSFAEREARGPGSPHYFPPSEKIRVQLWVNQIAVEGPQGPTHQFPSGSILIKEKLNPEGKVVGLGGMLKLKPPSDASPIDNWRFFYQDKSGKLFTSKLENCAACHTHAPNDHVFTVFYEKSITRMRKHFNKASASSSDDAKKP